jgi:hypothetical protein
MPKPGNVVKAKLITLRPQGTGEPQEVGEVPVQFNPQTLKLSFSVGQAGTEKKGSSQHVMEGTTKLSLELWFDVTLPRPAGMADPQGDVRRLTKPVAAFLKPKDDPGTPPDKRTPPLVRFSWGTFRFDGIVESMEETIDLFSEDGRPLRASVSLSIAKQDLEFQFGGGGANALLGALGGSPVGINPLELAKAGESLQQMAARMGAPDWKAVARANGIENPRRLAPGTLLDFSGGAARLPL